MLSSINFDILNGDKAIRFFNSASVTGTTDELSFKYDKTDSRIKGLNENSISYIEAMRYMFNQIKDQDDQMIQHYNNVTKLYGNIGKTWNEETIFKKMESELPERSGNIKDDIVTGFGGKIRLTTVVPLSIVPLGTTFKNDKNEDVTKAALKAIPNFIY